MKNLKETYVIIKQFDSYSSLVQDYVSFDKSELDEKCASLNEYYNKKISKEFELNIFQVVSLKEAIELVIDDCVDSHTEHDESY